MNIIDELAWRDAINQQTNEEGLRELTEKYEHFRYIAVSIQLEIACILDI